APAITENQKVQTPEPRAKTIKKMLGRKRTPPTCISTAHRFAASTTKTVHRGSSVRASTALPCVSPTANKPSCASLPHSHNSKNAHVHAPLAAREPIARESSDQSELPRPLPRHVFGELRCKRNGDRQRVIGGRSSRRTRLGHRRRVIGGRSSR